MNNNATYNGQLGRDPGYGQATMAQSMAEQQAKQAAYENQRDCGIGLAGSLSFNSPNSTPSAPLRQIAAANAETLKSLENKLREVRGCTMNSPCQESKACPPDVCGLPSIESSLVETEYTVFRLHALADELLARL